jgi:hypothetical protein
VVTFGTSIGNTLSTTISGTPASKSTFDIASASGLQVNDCITVIQAGTLGPARRKVTGLASTTVTLNEDLDAIPTAGLTFAQEWARVFLVTNGTGSAGTGTVASVCPYYSTKSSSQSRAITFTLRIKGT